MTKQELLSTCTAEQLAEMVEDLRKGNERLQLEAGIYAYCILPRATKEARELIDNRQYFAIKIVADQEGENREKNLQSEAEKYRKAFEDAKKERDQQVCEYQKKIEELAAENKKYLEQIMASIPLSYGYSVSEVARAIFEHCNSNAVRLSNKNRFDYSREIEKAGKDGCEIYILGLIKCLQGLCNGENYTEENLLSKFLPTEPIKVADMLINAEGEYEHDPVVKKICGTDKGKYRIFDVSELRQIAEHLLIYCNHHGKAEE